ncbi:hypothetical protein FHS34_007956 [Streptomyces echinatus]|uniref:Uncharacterized protein n=1 Tax=Streptomyces echinatus TaxID=67293 RepID=A0A7W9UVM9_9ACTN|nr:hypothetical protein [Streptomyces echinatus]
MLHLDLHRRLGELQQHAVGELDVGERAQDGASESSNNSRKNQADSLRSLAAMMVWLNVAVIRLTSLLFETENGLAVRECREVRVPN